jgi:hypothetical protein
MRLARFCSLALLLFLAAVLVLMTSCGQPAKLLSITVSPADPSVAKGLSDQFSATGRFSDGTSRDVTGSATWTSLDSSVATIAPGGLATAVGTGTATIQAAVGAVMGQASLQVTLAALVSIAIAPANPSIPKGLTQQFTASGTYTDGSTQNLTGSATWTSLEPGILGIAAGGLGTAVSTGTATVQAASGSITGQDQVTVGPAVMQSVTVSGPASIPQGIPYAFTASAEFSDGSLQNVTSSVTWTSSAPAIASVSASGTVLGLGPGPAAIQATVGALQGASAVTVTKQTLVGLVVSPQYPTIPDGGATEAFTAIGTLNDGTAVDLTSEASWSSTSAAVGAVSAAGLATSQSLPSGQTAGFTSIEAVIGKQSGVAILSVTARNGNGFAGVLTQHGDIGRTGENTKETALTPSNVNSTTFGKLFSHSVDGYVYAQPLYVPSLTIGGQTHNVVFVATEHDSIYAFDADSNAGANAQPLWQVTLLDSAHGATAGETTQSSASIAGGRCEDLTPEIGITSTPVIDPSANALYAVAASVNPATGQYFQRLHAIDITTGGEKFGGPMAISGSVTGPLGNTATFDPHYEMNRPGLLLLNGSLYLGFASHCDLNPPEGWYYGWLFAFSASTLQQQAIFNPTPDTGWGGIWMSGAGPSGDDQGNVYLSIGNGQPNPNCTGPYDYSDAVARLRLLGGKFQMEDYFQPTNYCDRLNNDADAGTSGALLVPDQPGKAPHEMVVLAKTLGGGFLIDRDQMTAGNVHWCAPYSQTAPCQGAVGGLQELDPEILENFEPGGQPFATPAFWNGNLYVTPAGAHPQEYSFTVDASSNTSILGQAPATESADDYGGRGASPTVSANGEAGGIVWQIDATWYGPPESASCPAVLRAYDATNLAISLYASPSGITETTPLTCAVSAGTVGIGIKFSVPTVADGKVYVGAQYELDVLGLLP